MYVPRTTEHSDTLPSRTPRASRLARRATVLSQLAAVSISVAGAACAASKNAGAGAPSTRVTVTATDFAFQAPDTAIAGPTALRLVNRGPDLHHVSLVRLDDGKTIDDVLAALKAGGPPPAWVHEVGGPNTPAPGGESMAVVDLKAGSYALLCFIPSKDGVPHIIKGMTRPLTVVPASKASASVTARLAADAKDAGAAAAAPLPASDVTMTLTDYDFTLSKPLAAGRRVVRVRNEAAQSHEVFIARLAPGKTTPDLLAWLEKQEGPPPAMPMGGTTGMAKGEWNDVVLDLAAGDYALICFVPDAKDGKPHFMHGMSKQVTVR